MKIKTVETQSDGIIVHWTNGEQSRYALEDMPAEMQTQCAVHGLTQKTMDKHANATKLGWSIAECKILSDGVFDNLKNSIWNEGGRGTGTRTLIWMEAVARVANTQVDAAFLETWGELSKEAIAELKGRKSVLEAKAELELEAANALEEDAEAVDVAKLFAA